MTASEAWTAVRKGFKWAIGIIVGLAIALVIRRPKAQKHMDEPPPPDMKKADENVKQLEVQQEVIREQHKEIEKVLAPKPVPEKSLRDSVRDWNEDK